MADPATATPCGGITLRDYQQWEVYKRQVLVNLGSASLMYVV